MNSFIFRVDRNNFVLEELKQGRLRQGWGASNMELLNKNGELISQKEWCEKFRWSETEERKISKYNNLKNMLNMREGDLVIIPRTPTWDSFSIGKIRESYQFSMDKNSEDFGHLLELDINSIKSYTYGSNDIVREITSKFGSYQSPINNVRNSQLLQSIENLLKEDFKNNEIKKEYLEHKFTINSYSINLEELEEKIVDKKIEYTIPIYQRPYSWGKKEITRFLQDIIESFADFEENKLIIKNRNMFIGTIQLNQSDDSKLEVIDGQQRLTTLNLLMLALQDKNGNPIRYFTTEVGGQEEYLKELFIEYSGRELEIFEEINSSNIYRENFLIISQILKELSELESFRSELICHIKKNLKFVVVETKASLTETLSIFDTINTSGLDLNGADVFKIKIYEYLKKIENKSPRISREIFPEIDKLYTKVQDKNKIYNIKVSIVDILDIYKDYLIALNGFPMQTMKMGTSTFFEKLFDGLIRGKLDSDFLSNENFKKIELNLEDIDGLIESRFYWESIKENLSLETKFEEKFIWWSRYGRYFKVIYFYLFKNREKNDLKELSILISKLSKLFIVYSVLFDKQVNSMMTFMGEISSSILIGDSNEHILSEIKRKTTYHSDNWKNTIKRPLANKTTSKNLLCRIDAMLQEGFNISTSPNLIKNIFEKNIDIEHIQASNPKENSDSIRETWGEEIDCIGNLMILESEINRSIQNKVFSEKKEHYLGYSSSSGSKYQVVKNIAKNSDWTKENAKERKENIAESIYDYIYSEEER